MDFVYSGIYGDIYIPIGIWTYMLYGYVVWIYGLYI